MKRIILTLVILTLFIAPVIASPTLEDGTGLMDSCWPMFQHDLKHTGRSPYGLPGNTPYVKWIYTMGGSLAHTSPAIDKEGIIYISDSYLVEGRLYALYPNGTLKWRYEHSDWVRSSPAIAEDGTIYMGCNNGRLYAFHPDGTLKWKTKLGDWIASSPVIAKDGTIYVGSYNNNFYAVNPNGTVKWSYKTGYAILSSAAIDDNGIIYIGSHDNHLYAFYPNGTVKWKFKTFAEVKSAPAIGEDGTIYVCSWDGNLYAINSDGRMKWKFPTGDAAETSPAIGYNGDIYVGSYNGKVFSVSPDGSKNWEYQVGSTTSDGWILASMVVDKNGVIYACSLDGHVIAFQPDGSQVWRYDVGRDIEPSPSIGADGTLYFACDEPGKPKLYALQVVENQPPDKPSITDGTSSGATETVYQYTCTAMDPDGDHLYYQWDWDDSTISEWLGPVPSGETITMNHTWVDGGVHQIKVYVKDVYGAVNESDEFTVSLTGPDIEILGVIGGFPIKIIIVNKGSEPAYDIPWEAELVEKKNYGGSTIGSKDGQLPQLRKGGWKILRIPFTDHYQSPAEATLTVTVQGEQIRTDCFVVCGKIIFTLIDRT